MPTYIVGDLQGCLTPLQRLLDKVAFASTDQLWLVGDLVNRGPQSLETLRFLYQLRDNITTVLGNHDLHLLAVAEGIRQANKSDTLDDILQAPDREQLLNWLRQQPLLHHDADKLLLLVHAGIPPTWSLEEALARAQKFQQALKSDAHYYPLLASMYGNEPANWCDDLNQQMQWRVIANALTRMRFCQSDGTLELRTKGAPELPPTGFAPWFCHKAHHILTSHRIFFGHWAALEGCTTHPNAIALDTGCVWGKCMTLFCLESHRRYQVNFRDCY